MRGTRTRDGLVDLHVADPNGARLWSTRGWEWEDGVTDAPPIGPHAMGDPDPDGFSDLAVPPQPAGPTPLYLGRAEGLPLNAEAGLTLPLPASETDAPITPGARVKRRPT